MTTTTPAAPIMLTDTTTKEDKYPQSALQLEPPPLYSAAYPDPNAPMYPQK